ncbi:OPT-domain-containing protein [Mycena sanguinolenta]|uniref:OPT-domain-containing protein n=1 Tax=Mycena sanguinolenta TaxID=230812 RepID=A0A8H6ZAM1_9AGAR|nr:OPT-domain-containing protein [Mycena sanguinolenta]
MVPLQDGSFEAVIHLASFTQCRRIRFYICFRIVTSVPFDQYRYTQMSKTHYLEKAPSSESFVDKAPDLVDVDVIAADIQAVAEDVLEAAEYAKTMSPEEVETVIHRIVDEHSNDPNFPSHVLDAANRYLFDTDLKEQPGEYQRLYDELKVEAAMIVINSPYAEVRAVIDNHDDVNMPANTFRTWIIGSILVAAGAFLNQFFSIRYPAIGVGSNVAQILAVPLGKLMELLPTTEFETFGYTWSLNPGPFNPKEHMLITIMANVGFITPYTSNIIWIQYLPLYFNQSWALGFGYQILVALSTNLIGYGLAGLTRRFLVYPASAIWPGNLAQIALNRAFHADKATVANGWSISRLRWFLYCFGAMFVYFWFPDFICISLSYFNWMTWISPTNVSLAAITGSMFGLGFNPLPTFDWNQMIIDPLINPFFTTFNFFLGTLITFPIIAAIWYTNTWNTGYLPINSNYVFDNTGNLYDVAEAVGTDMLFNQTMYENYSPAYLSASYAMEYGVFFALYTATLSYAFLNYRREIIHGFRSILSREKTSSMHKDVHVRLMENYKEVPEWQYFMQVLLSDGSLWFTHFHTRVLVFAVVVGAVGIGVYPTNTSPAVVLYGVFLAMIFCVPVGIIAAITNMEVTLNVLAEFFGGLWFNGNATAMNYFKTYGYITTSQTISFASDLKLAHYMHIPPQLTFSAQIYATVISTFVCTGILNFQMTQIPGVCTPDQPNHFICPGVNTFFTASVLWGTLGPKRMFGPGGIYNGLLWCFLIGAILPIPIYYLRKKVKALEFIHMPVLLVGGLVWSPYSLANVWPAVPIAYLFNVFIKKRYIAWWSKYNYVTTTAFSAAIAICGIVIFFAIEWPGVQINWSGNTRPLEGCDAMGCTRLPIPDQGWFGPGVGEFH